LYKAARPANLPGGILQQHLHDLRYLRYRGHEEALWFIIFGSPTVMMPQALPFVISKVDAYGAFK